MIILDCWHRPGVIRHFRRIALRTCRTCGVPVEECPCDRWRVPDDKCPICSGSGWVAVVRSRSQLLFDSVDLCIESAGAPAPSVLASNSVPSVNPPVSSLGLG